MVSRPQAVPELVVTASCTCCKPHHPGAPVAEARLWLGQDLQLHICYCDMCWPHSALSELGKLRSLAVASGADLGERLRRDVIALARFHRDFPLFPALSGALVVQEGTATATTVAVLSVGAVATESGASAFGRCQSAQGHSWRRPTAPAQVPEFVVAPSR